MYSKDLKNLFLLNKEVAYLNHGSFGACPKEIMDHYFKIQLKLESEPIDFLDNNIDENLKLSKKALSQFIDCNHENLIFFPNPSTAINMVAKSLKFNRNDEILTTNHEYGALVKMWKYICSTSGAKYIEYKPKIPIASKTEFINGFFDKINSRTKIIFISHITSPTGLIFPVKEICQEANKRNIISIVDGAHAPAHINFSINDINPDVYVGACHKWMMSPKGSSFIYVKKEFQKKLKPLVISWGWDNPDSKKSIFVDYHQWQGTNDISPYLVIPYVLEFMKKYNWPEVSRYCKKLNLDSRLRLLELFNKDVLCEKPSDWLGQMSSIILPKCNALDLYQYLRSNNIEVPISDWLGYQILRISIQAYNSEKDVSLLIKYLKRYFNV